MKCGLRDLKPSKAVQTERHGIGFIELIDTRKVVFGEVKWGEVGIILEKEKI